MRFPRQRVSDILLQQYYNDRINIDTRFIGHLNPFGSIFHNYTTSTFTTACEDRIRSLEVNANYSIHPPSSKRIEKKSVGKWTCRIIKISLYLSSLPNHLPNNLNIIQILFYKKTSNTKTSYQNNLLITTKLIGIPNTTITIPTTTTITNSNCNHQLQTTTTTTDYN